MSNNFSPKLQWQLQNRLICYFSPFCCPLETANKQIFVLTLHNISPQLDVDHIPPVLLTEGNGTLPLLTIPELLNPAVVPQGLSGELRELALSWKGKELLDGRFEGNLKLDKGALLRDHGVFSGSLPNSITSSSFMSFSEPSESLSVLLSESAKHSARRHCRSKGHLYPLNA